MQADRPQAGQSPFVEQLEQQCQQVDESCHRFCAGCYLLLLPVAANFQLLGYLGGCPLLSKKLLPAQLLVDVDWVCSTGSLQASHGGGETG